jgi:hypothetical protein
LKVRSSPAPCPRASALLQENLNEVNQWGQTPLTAARCC